MIIPAFVCAFALALSMAPLGSFSQIESASSSTFDVGMKKASDTRLDDSPCVSCVALGKRYALTALQRFSPSGDGLAPIGLRTNSFGSDIASADAIVAISAPLEFNDNDPGTYGSVYVFRHGTNGLEFLSRLAPPIGSRIENFGGQVATDGEFIFATATEAASTRRYAVHIFSREGESWLERGVLSPSDLLAGDFFGLSLAVSGDFFFASALNFDSGRGWVYVFRNEGGSWQQVARLNAPGGSASNLFGWSIAASQGTLLVGAPLDPGGAGEALGSAYVYEYRDGIWIVGQRLRPQDGLRGQDFGDAVAIEGGQILIGAPSSTYGSRPGAAYYFAFSGTHWIQRGRLFGPEMLSGDRFGWAVAIDDNRAYVGMPRFHGAAGESEGRVSSFQRAVDGWRFENTLRSSAPFEGNGYGMSIAAEAGWVIVGEPSAPGVLPSSTANEGAVEVFRDEGLFLAGFEPPLPNALAEEVPLRPLQ